MAMHTSKPSLNLGDLPPQYLIRKKELLTYLPFGATTLWKYVKSGEFPASVSISSHIAVWRVGDVLAWLSCVGEGRKWSENIRTHNHGAA